MALNCALAVAVNTPVTVVIDADTLLAFSAFRWLTVPFARQPKIGAVTSNPIVLNRGNLFWRKCGHRVRFHYWTCKVLPVRLRAGPDGVRLCNRLQDEPPAGDRRFFVRDGDGRYIGDVANRVALLGGMA